MEPFSALLAICAGNSPVPVNSPHKGQWRGALMFSLICVWINDWINNREAGDLRRYRVHYDVTVMICSDRSLTRALTLLMLRPEYSGILRSMSWLLGPWLHASPGHQQQWHWQCEMRMFSRIVNRNNLLLFGVNTVQTNVFISPKINLIHKCLIG